MDDDRFDHIAALLKALEVMTQDAATIHAELSTALQRTRQRSARENATTEPSERRAVKTRRLRTRRVRKRRTDD